MIALAIHILCAATSLACSVLLYRGYRRTGARLLFWSGLCFLLLAGNNFVVIIDMLVIENIDFRMLRIFLSLAAVSVLLFGLIWESR